MRRHQGHSEEAHCLLEESLADTAWAPNHVFGIQSERARLLHQQGKLDEARALHQEIRALQPTRGDTDFVLACLEGWAALQAALGKAEDAARLWGAA